MFPFFREKILIKNTFEIFEGERRVGFEMKRSRQRVTASRVFL